VKKSWGILILALMVVFLIALLAASTVYVMTESRDEIMSVQEDVKRQGERRDAVGQCVNTLTARWEAAVTLTLEAEDSSADRARWAKVAHDLAVKQQNISKVCYGDNPDAGPDPFVDPGSTGFPSP
jgi:hypothetical protein